MCRETWLLRPTMEKKDFPQYEQSWVFWWILICLFNSSTDSNCSPQTPQPPCGSSRWLQVCLIKLPRFKYHTPHTLQAILLFSISFMSLLRTCFFIFFVTWSSETGLKHLSTAKALCSSLLSTSLSPASSSVCRSCFCDVELLASMSTLGLSVCWSELLWNKTVKSKF